MSQLGIADSTGGTPEAASDQLDTLYAVPDPHRELTAWGEAVIHLHGLGLPAAVPELPAVWLRRRGVYADWMTAA
jgi:hypothetical protein